MSLRWRKLAGDTSEFAVEIAFERDPDGGPPKSAEISESWGSFRFWAQGQNLCAHAEDEESVDSVHWYLLPLIEWLVDHWDPLFHEEKPPHKQTRGSDGWSCLSDNPFPPPALSEEEDLDWLAGWQEWWNRHCLQAAREGGLFPGIVFRRWRQLVEVSWGPDGLVGAPPHFRFAQSRGHARFDPKQVTRPLYEVLGEAIRQLATWVPGSKRLADLAERHQKLQSDRSTERLGWLAGIGAERWRAFLDSLREHRQFSRQAIAELLSYEEPDRLVVSGSCRAALMFGTLSPNLSEADMLALASQLIQSTGSAGASSRLEALARSTAVDEPQPWRQAYDLAEQVLQELDLWNGSATAIDLDDSLRRLGIRVDDVRLDDVDTRGAAFVSPVHRATILVNAKHPVNDYPPGRRFTLAHELCHLLFDQNQGRELALASGPWAPADIEKRANAFAAMFLMPTARIRLLIESLGGSLKNGKHILKIAATMETSFSATLEHLANLGFLSATLKQAIEVEAA